MNNGNASCWPIVMRELRAEARKPANRWLRFLAAMVAVAIYAVLSMNGAYGANELGQSLFHCLNAVMLAMIVLLVPLLAADCISSERREGTLGLLFLTPLTPWQIVLGKSLIHGIRSASIFLAIVPLLALPLLLGGVSFKEFAMAVLIDSTAMCLSLAAGIIVSSHCRKMMRALVIAEFFSLCLALVFFIANASIAGVISAGLIGGFNWARVMEAIIRSYRERPLADFVFGSFAFNAGLEYRFSFTGWQSFFSSTIPLQQAYWFTSVAGLLIAAALFLIYGMSYAAKRMRRAWRELPPSPTVVQLQKTFCTPIIWKKAFHKGMKRLLERNPIGWVQRSSWSSRIGGWCWCLAYVFLETLFLAGDPMLRDLRFGHLLLVHVLFMGLAFSAAGSFQHERDSGLMELILITPLSVSQIINGRLRAVWSQFFPAALVLFLVALAINDRGILLSEISFYFGDHFNARLRYAPLLFAAGSFFLVPIVGLYYSQLRIHFIGAWAATMAFGFAIPLMFGAMILRATSWGNAWLILTQLATGWVFWQLLYHNLSHRAFSFGRKTPNLRSKLNS